MSGRTISSVLDDVQVRVFVRNLSKVKGIREVLAEATDVQETYERRPSRSIVPHSKRSSLSCTTGL